MKLNEKMLAAMRKATELLQREGPGASTSAIQRTLQRLMPAKDLAKGWAEKAQPSSALPSVAGGNVTKGNARPTPPPTGPMKDINPAPRSRAGDTDTVNDVVSELLAGLGIRSPLGRSDVSAFAPQSDQDAQADAAGGQFLSGSYSNHAGTRSYKLYVPTGYRGQPLPLVVMLHGCTQNPDDFAAGTRMNAIAEEKQCLVVYPAQSKSANGSKCWNWFNAVDQQREQGEPSIIAGITREIIKTYHVDARQVYVAGLSAGGAMAVIMGTTYPDLYAAVGIHSGLPYAAANDLSSALAAMRGSVTFPGQRSGRAMQAGSHLKGIPVIVFHGDRDTTVHPQNAEHVVTQAVPQSADHLSGTATGNGAPGAVHKGQVPNGHAYTRTVHSDRSGKAIAEHWLIHGAAHAWSGGSSKGSYTDSKGPNASQEMMRFFSTSPRNTRPLQ
ncbi:MAG TPA: PHB depolymerase family esterase [Burkholderiaceae bacterium]|jgi:poly(hydroxyalkanoate) depolymerase family esterase|nr:PHB depolymerase family esterase [Burkholderiaceae bacterium]